MARNGAAASAADEAPLADEEFEEDENYAASPLGALSAAEISDDDPPFDPPDSLSDALGASEDDEEFLDEVSDAESLEAEDAEAEETAAELEEVPSEAADDESILELSPEAAIHDAPIEAETTQAESAETEAGGELLLEHALRPEDDFIEEEAEFVASEDTSEAARLGVDAGELADEDPPFDPPDEDDPIFTNGIAQPARAPASAPSPGMGENAGAAQPAPAQPSRRAGDERRAIGQPVPPISIHASWDRPEMAELLAGLSYDKRLSRAEISIGRGGLDGAIVRFSEQASPDLLIVDTTLCGMQLLRGLDRLARVLDQNTKLIVLGAINDIGLLRELVSRGVDEYLVPPFRRDTLIQNICALYADIDKSRVIAVIGARGGVGASTIAHNLAWSIAELQHAHTTLFDLDLPFGAIGFGMRPPREDNVSEMLAEPASIDDALLDRITTHQTQHLQLLTAPARLERAVELDPNALQSLLARVRRTSSFVVLDLPHAWNSWIKQTLASADDVIIVAGPDLASLRNAKNMLDMLSASRPHSPPIVALSMTGVPDRPEIQPKEFAEAIDTEPLVSFAFEPGLFGMCAINNQMIGEAAPYSKAALSLDLLAATVTGRKPAQPKAPPRKGAAPARVFANAIVGAAPVSAAFAAAAMQEAAPEAQAKPAPATAAPEVEGSAAPAEFAAPAPAAQARRAGDMPSPAWRTERRRRAAPPHRTGEQLMLPFEAEEPDEELDFAAPPLELVREARAPAYVDYYARAREAALHDLIARENVKEEPDLTPRRQFARIAAGALTVAILGGAWHVHSQRQTELTTEANAAITHEEPAPPVLDAWADETARYAFAIELLEVGRAQEAATLLRRTAEDGFPMAQYRLAKLYERGEGVEADLGLARQWTERAAGGGNRRAMHDLGVYYARGEGAMLDDSTAFRWFRLAAEFGVADSQYNLGLLYQQGRGVAEDAKEALFWFLVAAAQGDEAAIARVAIVEAQLTPLEVEQARARARAFHARPGNPIANGEFAARAEPVIEGVFEAPAPAPAPEAASSDG